MENLTTVDAVIDAFHNPGQGRNQGCAAVVGVSPKAVHMWRDRGQIAPQHYEIMKAALAEMKKEAPSSLWGIREPEQQAPQAAEQG